MATVHNTKSSKFFPFNYIFLYSSTTPPFHASVPFPDADAGCLLLRNEAKKIEEFPRGASNMQDFGNSIKVYHYRIYTINYAFCSFKNR